MTFADAAKELGRSPCVVVEFDLDYCSLTYASAPCTAVLGTTGSDRCMNTCPNCQDLTNFTPTTKTYRFSNREILDPAAMSDGVPCLPMVKTVSSAPTILDPGRSIGARASVTITFQDQPLSDRGIDKYVSLRSYNSAEQGTFWTKFRARNKYYNGRVCRIRTGYLVDGLYDENNFQTRTYIIDSIKGPDARGMVTVNVKDVLKLADNTKAQCPLPNTGKLLTDITDSDMSATLTPPGIGDEEYDSSGTICIGSECITFTRVADALTFVARATDGTTVDSHNANDVVQQCKRWTSEMPQDIVYELLTDFADVPTGYIDKTAWDDECHTWLFGHTLTRLLTKPTGVKDLLDELCEQGLVSFWWNEIEATIPLRAVRPPRPDEVTAFGEDYQLLADSVSIDEEAKDRISEVQLQYGIYDPTGDDKDENFSRRLIEIDTDSESAVQYNTVGVKRIFSRWLGPNDARQAALIGFRLLSRYRDNLVTAVFSVDAKDSGVWTGDAITIATRLLTDEFGATPALLFEVIQAQDTGDGSRFNYQALRSLFNGRYGYITENDMVDYSAATAAQKLVNGFITQNDGKMPDGSDGYVMV